MLRFMCIHMCVRVCVSMSMLIEKQFPFLIAQHIHIHIVHTYLYIHMEILNKEIIIKQIFGVEKAERKTGAIMGQFEWME